MKLNGYNHNINYQGILFHVQTEDYGKELHKIVTQLFHGGQIVSKTETDYANLLQVEDAQLQLKELMKAQHRKMLQALKDGLIAIPPNILASKKGTA